VPRAVAPWTWRRKLRDHGPEDPSFLLAMLMLNTWMDGEGFAYPGQPKWAKAARTSVRNLQRHIAKGRRLGWIDVVNAGRGGKGWAFNGYRCCVPDDVPLDEKDERISDAIIAQAGDVGDDTAMSSPTIPRAHGDDTERPMVTTNGHLGDDKSASWSRHSYVVQTPALRTPALRTPAKREAHTDVCAALALASEKKKTEEDQEAREQRKGEAIIALLQNGNTWDDIVKFTHSYGTTRDDVAKYEAIWRKTNAQWEQSHDEF
jgi:hypothetical protein